MLFVLISSKRITVLPSQTKEEQKNHGMNLSAEDLVSSLMFSRILYDPLYQTQAVQLRIKTN